MLSVSYAATLELLRPGGQPQAERMALEYQIVGMRMSCSLKEGPVLDVGAAAGGAQNGAALQLYAVHTAPRQHHRPVITIVEAPVPVPAAQQFWGS